MLRVNNKEVIEAHKWLASHLAKLSNLRVDLKDLEVEIQDLEDMIWEAKKVDEIYEGIALSLRGDIEVAAEDDPCRRFARVCPKYGDSSLGEWLLYTGERDEWGQKLAEPKWHGSWYTEEQANHWAREWVVNGKIPPKRMPGDSRL